MKRLKDMLTQFPGKADRKKLKATPEDPENRENYKEVFGDIASSILSGYFEIKKGDRPIKFIKPTCIEFYYHEEEAEISECASEKPEIQEDTLIKDYIVYHKNKSDRTVPLFEIGLLHNHVSGIDITFEHEFIMGKRILARASALIRGYYVYDETEEDICKYGNPGKNAKPEDRCTYLYNELYGTCPVLDQGMKICWKDSNIELPKDSIGQQPRKNVFTYTIKNGKPQKDKNFVDKRCLQFYNKIFYGENGPK